MDTPRAAISDGFTLALVGDCISTRPLVPRLASDPGFAEVIRRIRDASLAFGNLETSIFDIRTFAGHPRTADDWGMSAPPSVARDLRELGFDLMSRANNHAVDWGIGGLRETAANVEAAGLVTAGSGETLALARAARFKETAHGRVGLVSFYTTTYWDNDSAVDQFGQVPGRPGVNTVRLRRKVTAPQPLMEGMREVYRRALPDSKDPDPNDFTLFDTRFVSGETIEVAYDPSLSDIEGTLMSIHAARPHADLMIVSAHVHEEGPDTGTPPAFLRDLARATIDAGADVFVGHGVHRLWPVEMYKGCPIFYGLGNFIFSDIVEPLHRSLHESARGLLVAAGIDPAIATDSDVNRVFNAQDFGGDRYFESVIAELTYRDGSPAIRLHPIDLRYGTALTESGIPRPSDPERAGSTLKHLASMSESAGTEIGIENGTGILG